MSFSACGLWMTGICTCCTSVYHVLHQVLPRSPRHASPVTRCDAAIKRHISLSCLLFYPPRHLALSNTSLLPLPESKRYMLLVPACRPPFPTPTMGDGHDLPELTQSLKMLCAEKTEVPIIGAIAGIEPTQDATRWPSSLGGQ